MVTVYDVPAEQLILKTAQKLKENPNIVPLSGPSMSRPAGTQRGAPPRTTGGTLGPPPS